MALVVHLALQLYLNNNFNINSSMKKLLLLALLALPLASLPAEQHDIIRKSAEVK